VNNDRRKLINGALKQTINAHGPITKERIGSATKRILGALKRIKLTKDNINENPDPGLKTK
jgi:hypothetical protein